MHNDALKTGRNMAADWDARAEDNALYFIAEREDDVDFRASGEREAAQVLLNDVMVPPEATVLEIGCGIGRLLRPMAARFRQVIGFDVSTKMIEQSRAFLADLPNVKTYSNDGSTLPGIEANTVDFCYSFICFQHVPRKEFITSYLREALRVLKPGGIFKFQVDGQTWPGRPRNDAETWQGVWYTSTEIRQECLDAGYSVFYVTGGGTQHLWVLCQKPTIVRTRGLMVPDAWPQCEEAEERREFLVNHPETVSSPPLSAEVLAQVRLQIRDLQPFTVAPAQRFYLSLELTNASAFMLVSAPPNPMFISYHWMDKDARNVIVHDGVRSGIYPALEPGAHRRIKADILAPQEAGAYVLRLTLVQEGVRWFDTKPAQVTLDTPVEVRTG